MKTSLTRTCSSILLASLFTATAALAEDQAAPAGKDDAKMAEMMKAAELACAPGAAHKALEPLVGEWTVEVKCWMSLDAPPMVSKGTAKAQWVLNGRFIREDFTGDMMGQAFHGMALTGYDNLKKQYNNLWVDDMSTAIYTSLGTVAEDGKVFTFKGTMDDPMTGKKNLPVKQVFQIISADKHIFEMYDLSKGESKTMEMTYTRK